MNTNMTLTCDTCAHDIDCRIGYSNRDIQPLNFACPHCGTLICITLDITDAPLSDFEFSGANPHDDKQYGKFDGRNPFVDLHLDFPVWFGDYQMGMTPYMVAIQKIKTSGTDANECFMLMQYHNDRINQLNFFRTKASEVRSILKLYSGKNKQVFKKRVEQFIDKELNPSLEPQDINAALYTFVSFVFLPFVHFQSVSQFVEDFGEVMLNLANAHGPTFDAFIDHIIETSFLKNLQKDCLDLYPEIYGAELPLRPALFLDLIDGYERNKIAARVSVDDFTTYKDLYKDLAEVFGRQLILIAGINNIIRRDGHNNFAKPADGPALSSLDKFADKTLSDKFKYLDDCWYEFDQRIVDTKARNAIAHYTAEYDEVSQIITYFPEKEGVRQEQPQTMYFLDFMYMLLQLFRDIHYVHHIIKGLFYYEYLIRGPKRSA